MKIKVVILLRQEKTHNFSTIYIIQHADDKNVKTSELGQYPDTYRTCLFNQSVQLIP